MTSNQATGIPRAHNGALDGVRGIAILVVMLRHSQQAFQPSSAVSKLVLGLAVNGSLGVDLFFVLSGFLITGILLDHRGAPGALKNFYVRRILRIFPLYYAYLAFVFLIAARRTSVDVGPGGSLWFWLYAPNVLIQVRNHLLPYILNVTWSLGVEEQFYLVWPWVVAALDRRRLARLCIATFGLVLLARFAVAFLGSDAAPFAVRMIAQRGFDTLSLGALVAIMLREPSLATQLVALARRALLPMSVLAAAYLATTFFEVSSYASVVGLEVFELWLAVLVTFAAACPGNSRIGQFFDSPVLRNFGKYSYGLYLIHVPIDIFVGNSNHVGVARFATHLGSPVVGFALYATFLIAVSYVAARASWFLFESRFLGLKRFFEYEATPLRSDAATATERA